jgi:hypothetical protein
VMPDWPIAVLRPNHTMTTTNNNKGNTDESSRLTIGLGGGDTLTTTLFFSSNDNKFGSPCTSGKVVTKSVYTVGETGVALELTVCEGANVGSGLGNGFTNLPVISLPEICMLAILPAFTWLMNWLYGMLISGLLFGRNDRIFQSIGLWRVSTRTNG